MLKKKRQYSIRKIKIPTRFFYVCVYEVDYILIKTDMVLSQYVVGFDMVSRHGVEKTNMVSRHGVE
jgi:hypothetical protein